MSDDTLVLILALIKDLLSDTVYYQDPRIQQIERLLKNIQ